MNIRFIDLSFGYDEPLFSNLNLELETDKITLLQGENGSGKTTFCRLLSGLEKNYSGQILIEDSRISDMKAKEISEQLIYLKQEPIGNTVAATPDEDLMIWQSKFIRNLNEQYSIQRTEVLKALRIKEIQHTPFWEMSGGQIKRAGMAALLLAPQKYWILDEPTSGLHQEIVDILMDILEERKSKGFGTLIISHRQNIFNTLPDKVLKIENEKINEI